MRHPFSHPVRAGRIAGLAMLIALSATAVSAADAPPTLSVSGIGEVAAVPDRALVTTGVVTEAETAREALDLNSAALEQVMEELREAGIVDRDIATSGFSVEPRYHYPRGADGDDGPPRIVGYRVSNQLNVRVRDIDRLGNVLDRAVTVGANRIEGVAFHVSDADRHLDAARAEAVRDARRKAEIYAEAGEFELGRILTVSEQDDRAPVRPMALARMAMDAESVPVAAGEQTLAVRVDITWEIGQ